MRLENQCHIGQYYFYCKAIVANSYVRMCFPPPSLYLYVNWGGACLRYLLTLRSWPGLGAFCETVALGMALPPFFKKKALYTESLFVL